MHNNFYWKELKEMIKSLSYEKGDVVLSNGQISDFYVDIIQTSLNSKGAYLIGKLILEIIKDEFNNKIDAVGGMSTGANPLATSVSVLSHMEGKSIPAFYIRKEPKQHGTGRWIDGLKNIKEGSSVLILEDVLATGSATIKTCSRAEETGLKIAGIVSIFDRQEGGRESLEKAGYKLFSLFTKEQILQS